MHSSDPVCTGPATKVLIQPIQSAKKVMLVSTPNLSDSTLSCKLEQPPDLPLHSLWVICRCRL